MGRRHGPVYFTRRYWRSLWDARDKYSAKNRLTRTFSNSGDNNRCNVRKNNKRGFCFRLTWFFAEIFKFFTVLITRKRFSSPYMSIKAPRMVFELRSLALPLYMYRFSNETVIFPWPKFGLIHFYTMVFPNCLCQTVSWKPAAVGSVQVI